MEHEQQSRNDSRGDPGSRPVPPPSAGPAQFDPHGPPAQPDPHGPPAQAGWGAPASGQGHDPYGQPVNQSPYGYPAPHGYGAPSRRPGIIPLTPLALGDVLGGSFAAIRHNAAAVFGTALIVALLEGLAVTAATLMFLDTSFELALLAEAGVDPFASDQLAGEYIGQFFGALGVLVIAALLTVFTSVIAYGVLSVVVVRAAAGLKTSLGQAWRLTGRQVWSLAGLGGLYLLAGAVTAALLLGLTVALVIAAVTGDQATAVLMGVLLLAVGVGMGVLWVWLYVKVLLAPAAAAVEQHAPFRAIGRSWSLVRGHWWRTFGIVLLVTVVTGVIASVITTPLSLVGGLMPPFTGEQNAQQVLESTRVWTIVTMLVGTLVNAIVRAYLACVTALLYVDYRIRHESFDLDLAAAADTSGAGDDERFSTVRDVQAAAGTEDLVPGRRARTGTDGRA